MTRIGHMLAVMIILAALFPGPTVRGEEVTADLGDAVRFTIDVPETWTATVVGLVDDKIIMLEPKNGVPLRLVISPMPVPDPEMDIGQGIEKMIEEFRMQLVGAEVEEDPVIQPLSGPACRGSYISAMDNAEPDPQPGDMPYFTLGFAAAGRLVVSFHLSSDVTDVPEFEQALDIVRSARHLPPKTTDEHEREPAVETVRSARQQPQGLTDEPVRLRYPGKPWAFVLELPGFVLEPVEVSQDGTTVTVRGKNPETRVLIKIFLESSPDGWTAADHREAYWEQTKDMELLGELVKRDQVKRRRWGEMAILESLTPELMGEPVMNKNVNAFLVRDGVWINVHLSKPRFEDDEIEFFDTVLETIRFEE